MRPAWVLVAVLALAVVAHAKKEDQAMSKSERSSLMEEMARLHPARSTKRTEDPLDELSVNRADLFFRAADKNYDKLLSLSDLEESEQLVRAHLPGVEKGHLASFIQMADKDGDGKLNRNEFVHALAAGAQSFGLVEVDATRRRTGFLKNAFKKVKNAVIGKGQEAVRKIKGAVDMSQDSCVMCQYIVERLEVSVKAAGIYGAQGGQAPAGSIMLETASKQVSLPSEVDVAAAGQIANTRQSTRSQRQVEREKYNQIYRVVDLTLDDVCEQAMPNAYYGFCKAIYQTQAAVVDGLRYQYRAPDICFRVGMCGTGSYITWGVHSRYRK